MKKTIRQRILLTLTKQQMKEQKLVEANPERKFRNKQLVINSSVLTKTFKKDTLFEEDVHDIYMREARKMQKDGLLKRISRGQYTVSAKGKKLL